MSHDRIFTDVTDQVGFGYVDDEMMPLHRCVCGEVWAAWNGPILSIYKDQCTACPACGRKFYFKQSIQVMMMVEDNY